MRYDTHAHRHETIIRETRSVNMRTLIPNMHDGRSLNFRSPSPGGLAIDSYCMAPGTRLLASIFGATFSMGSTFTSIRPPLPRQRCQLSAAGACNGWTRPSAARAICYLFPHCPTQGKGRAPSDGCRGDDCAYFRFSPAFGGICCSRVRTELAAFLQSTYQVLYKYNRAIFQPERAIVD